MSIKHLIAVVLCLLYPILAFCAAPDKAQHAGQINALIPEAKRNGAPTKVKDDVDWNDLLHTEHSGRVRAGLGDGSIISLGSSSEIRVVQHDTASQRTELEMGFGKMRNRVAKITRPGGKYEVRTPLAVIGVIGTDFYVAHENNRTTVICYTGQVSVTPLGNAKVTKTSQESGKKGQAVYPVILLNAGEMVEIGVDSLPDQLRPKATPATVQQASIADTDLPEGQAEVLRADQLECRNRAVYPYSVVPGGVQSLDELKRVMEHDPVIARQFQGFDFERAHFVQASERQAAYVSYRIGERVYWTRGKVWLHPGETLITDGKIVARAKSGNRVSKVPLDAGSPLEPSEEELDQPYSGDAAAVNAASLCNPPPASPSDVAGTSTPASPRDVAGTSTPAPPGEVAPTAAGRKWWLLPLFAAPLAALPATGGSHEPLAVAPEPGTMLLLSSGLAGVYWRSRKYRRKK